MVIKWANKAGKAAVGGVGLGAFGAMKGLRNFTKNRMGPSPGEEGWEEYKESHKARAKVKEAVHGATRFAFSNMTEEERQRWGGTKKFLKGVTKVGVGALTLGAPIWAKPVHNVITNSLDKSIDDSYNREKKKVDDMTLMKKKMYMDKALAGKGPLFRAKRVAGLKSLMESGDLNKIYPNEKERNAVVRRIFKDALLYKPEEMKKLKSLAPDIASELARDVTIPKKTLAKAGLVLTDEDRKKGWVTLEDKLIATASPNDMKYWNKSFAEKAAKSKFAHKFWTGSQIAKGAGLFGTAFLDKFKEGMLEITGTKDLPEEEAIKKQKEFYAENNPYLKNYLSTSPARSLGIGFGPGRVKPREELDESQLKEMKKSYVQKWEGGELNREEKIEAQKIKVEELREKAEELAKKADAEKDRADIAYDHYAAEVALKNAQKKLDKMIKKAEKASKAKGGEKGNDLSGTAGNSKESRSIEGMAGDSKEKKTRGK